MKSRSTLTKRFFLWYERFYPIHVSVAAALFTLQLIHLFWLATDVLVPKLFGTSLFHFSGIGEYLIVLVDYIEIPALITASLLYVDELRRRFNWKSLRYLSYIQIQWFHLFWITDEFVVAQLTGSQGFSFPTWLALIAIFIDYLELPVIVDTLQKFYRVVKNQVV